MKKEVLILWILGCFQTLDLSAQSKRFSADFHGGMPYVLASITNRPSTFGGVGLRYNLTREISIQGLMEVGTLAGKQKVDVILDPDQNANYTSFTNNFFSYTANIQLNLNKVLNLRKHLKRFNPYFIVGTGFMQSNVTSIRVDYRTRHYNQNFYMSFSGLLGRYYVSPEIDLTFGINYYYSQTPFIDGIAIDKVNDSYMLNHIGVTYKIGARNEKQHIEWTNVIVNKKPIRAKKETKVIETKVEANSVSEPEDEEMLIVFYRNKIKRIQFENKQLEKENARQLEEINQFRKDLDSMQQVVKDLKEQIQQINTSRTSSPFVKLTLPEQELIPMITKKEIPYTLATLKAPELLSIPKVVTPPVKEIAASAPVIPATPAIATMEKKEVPQVINEIVAVAPRQTYRPSIVTPEPETKLIIEREKVTPVEKSHGQNEIVKKSDIQESSQVKTEKASHTKAKNESAVNSKREKSFSIEAIPTHSGAHVITAPPSRYNIVVGAYKSRKYAFILMDKLNKTGYQAAVFRRNPSSRILRVTVLSTDNREEAIRYVRKARREIDGSAWIQVYSR